MSIVGSEASIVPQSEVEHLSADEFKGAFRNHPAGVAVVTADDGTGPVAMTVSSVFSVSLAPPLLVFSASEFSSSTQTILNSETLIVHMLAADQLTLAQTCATPGSERFDGSIRWERLPTGEPLFSETTTWIRGRVVGRLNAGASTVIVVEALEARYPDSNTPASAARPLVYHNRTWHVLDDHSRIASLS